MGMQTTQAPYKLLLTPLEAAQALGVGRDTLYRLMARRAISSVKIGWARRIPIHALETYVRSLESSSDD